MSVKKEWWEEVVEKLQQEERLAKLHRARLEEHAYMLGDALRNLNSIVDACLKPHEMEQWAKVWDSAVEFLKSAKMKGLL